MIRHGQAPFLECSSKGEKRLSAFYAIVNGRSIEEQYQRAKVFRDDPNLDWRKAKGRAPINTKEVSSLYRRLWEQYIDEHPELLTLIVNATGLSDIFGRPFSVCQATELWHIRQAYLEGKIR